MELGFEGKLIAWQKGLPGGTGGWLEGNYVWCLVIVVKFTGLGSANSSPVNLLNSLFRGQVTRQGPAFTRDGGTVLTI